MDDSILPFVKQAVGINSTEKAFDPDIVMNINLVFSTLYQLGIGPRSNYINGEETWLDVFYDYVDLIGLIKPYTVMKVRLAFDPPTNSFVLDSINKQIQEMEWRIKEQAEGGFEEDEEE